MLNKTTKQSTRIGYLRVIDDSILLDTGYAGAKN